MADLASLRRVRTELAADLAEAIDGFREQHPLARAIAGVDAAIEALEATDAPALPLGLRDLPIGPATPPTTTIGIALDAIRQAGEPLTTTDIFTAVNRLKKFANPRKGKINVVSAMSKDRRLKSLIWKGQYAWWPVGDPLPNPPKPEARP